MLSNVNIVKFLLIEVPYFAKQSLLGGIVFYVFLGSIYLVQGGVLSVPAALSGLKTITSVVGMLLFIATMGNAVVKYLYLREDKIRANKIKSGEISLKEAQDQYRKDEESI
jgi:UPF0716 family protein affecting phage T7 exclusion